MILPLVALPHSMSEGEPHTTCSPIPILPCAQSNSESNTIFLPQDSAEYLQKHNLSSGVCFRSFQQIAWLHEQLLASFPDLLVPPFPDPPLSSQIEDQDIVERKRIQIGRFLEKLGMRQEFNESPSFVHFLSHDMVKILLCLRSMKRAFESLTSYGLLIDRDRDRKSEQKCFTRFSSL
jgi:PX domain